MKFLEYIPLLSTLSSRVALTPRTIQGLDISRQQTNPNLTEAHTVGLSFVYIKATEGPTYTDPKFAEHFREATDASFLRGGYHVAHTDLSDGSTQAHYFVSNGGGWAADGKTLPGLLSIGMTDDCAGLSPQQTQDWIKAFVDTYNEATNRSAVIGTRNEWWVECTGNMRDFNGKNALLLASWGDSVGMIPGGWQFATIWQYKEGGAWGGNSNIFQGDADALKKLVDG